MFTGPVWKGLEYMRGPSSLAQICAEHADRVKDPRDQPQAGASLPPSLLYRATGTELDQRDIYETAMESSVRQRLQWLPH